MAACTHPMTWGNLCTQCGATISGDNAAREEADAARERSSKIAQLKTEIRMLEQHVQGGGETKKVIGQQASKMKASLAKKRAALTALSRSAGAATGGGGSTSSMDDAIGWGSHGGGITQEGVKVNRKYREDLDRTNTEMRLLKRKKLSLMVDLDKTVIHTTYEDASQAVCEMWRRGGVPIHEFYLNREHRSQPHTTYFTALRPGTIEFFERMMPYFEMHVFTMGKRRYAEEILKIIDPNQKYFGNRIKSRNESFSLHSKTANFEKLFPSGTHMAAVIDDSPWVWEGSEDNLITIVPFLFFRERREVNALATHNGVAAPSQEFDLAVQKRQAVADALDITACVSDDALAGVGGGGGADQMVKDAIMQAMLAELEYRIGSEEKDPAAKAAKNIAQAGLPADLVVLQRAVKKAAVKAAAAGGDSAKGGSTLKEVEEDEAAGGGAAGEGGGGVAAAAAGSAGAAADADADPSATPPGSPGQSAQGAKTTFDSGINAEIARGVGYVDAALVGCDVQFKIVPEAAFVDKLQLICTPADAAASVEVVGYIGQGKARSGVKRRFLLRHVENLNNVAVNKAPPAGGANAGSASAAASMTATFCCPPLLEKEDTQARTQDAVRCILTRLRQRQFRCAALLCRAFRHFVPMAWPEIKETENPSDTQVLQYLACVERHQLVAASTVPMYRWPAEKDDNVAGQPCLKVVGDILMDGHRKFFADHARDGKADLRTILPGLQGKYRTYPPWILRGAIIVFADDVSASGGDALRSVHAKKAKEVGGKVVTGLTPDVTHVIARSIDANVLVAGGGVPVPLCAWQEVGWHKLGVQLVTLDWLKACVKNQAWADEAKGFLLQPLADADVVKATKAAVKQAGETEGAEAALRLVAGTEKEQKRAAILGKLRYSATKLAAAEPGDAREKISAEHTQLLEDKELIEELLEAERENRPSDAAASGGGGGGGTASLAMDIGSGGGDVDAEFMDLMNGDDSDSDDSVGSGGSGGSDGGGGSSSSEKAALFSRPAKRKRDDADSHDDELQGGSRGGGGGRGRATKDGDSSSSSSDDDDGDDDTFALDLEAAMQGGDSYQGGDGNGDEDEDPFA